MPLFYNQALKLFIYSPLKEEQDESLSATTQPTPEATQDLNQSISDPLIEEQIEEQKSPSSTARPAPKEPEGKSSFFRSPQLKQPPPAKQKKNLFSSWGLILFDTLLTVSGWIGITIYHNHYPIQLSLAGVFIYLCYKALIRFFVRLGIIICENYFDTGDRQHLITLKLGSFKYEIIRADPFSADLERRGGCFREFRGFLLKHFPKLNSLWLEKYNYDNISPSSDFSQLRIRNRRRRKDTSDQKILRELVRNSAARLRWKYKDPRLQEFIEQFQARREDLPKWQWYLWLISFFLIEIPSEDGLFFAPPALLGINVWTTVGFALLFGFAHFYKYSAIQCLSIAAAAILNITFILPKYGLLTCMVGHVLFDIFVIDETVDKILYKIRQWILKKL
jgi:hypothetical protein